MSKRIKVALNGEHRLLSLSKEFSYDELLNAIKKLIGPRRFRIYWFDEDNDQISVLTNDDVVEMRRHFGAQVIRITVDLLQTPIDLDSSSSVRSGPRTEEIEELHSPSIEQFNESVKCFFNSVSDGVSVMAQGIQKGLHSMKRKGQQMHSDIERYRAQKREQDDSFLHHIPNSTKEFEVPPEQEDDVAPSSSNQRSSKRPGLHTEDTPELHSPSIEQFNQSVRCVFKTVFDGMSVMAQGIQNGLDSIKRKGQQLHAEASRQRGTRNNEQETMVDQIDVEISPNYDDEIYD